MRHLDDAERRARIARRHAVAPAYRLADPVAATRAVTVLHATEPPSVHLAVAARTERVGVAEVERALYDDRSLVKQLAMRRTLFAFPRDLLPAVWGSASARTAGAELRRLVGDVERAGVTTDGAAWLEAATRELLDHLGAAGESSARSLREQVPKLDTRITYGGGRWALDGPVGPRLVTVLGARGDLVRGRNAGHWRISKPQWTPMAAWLGEEPQPRGEAEGYAELVRRWLVSFGPGTEADLVWWLGATTSAVRRALADVSAVEVGLDRGAPGWVLPGDEAPGGPVDDWAALLPTLDPTTMGWKERDFYLDPGDRPYLFDTNGNGGTTAWWNGWIVGCWVQDPDGVVRVVTRGELGGTAREALEVEAARLTAWLDGEVVGTVYSSPQMKGARLP